jgi:hypothetical protein
MEASMRTGPEHRTGWRKRIDVDGETVLVEAIHHPRRRNPRGHEIAQQAMRGQPWHQVEETDHEWAVVHGGRRVCTLRQSASGDFHIGALRSFPRLDIEQAAAAAFLVMRPRRPAPAHAPDPAEAGEPTPQAPRF